MTPLCVLPANQKSATPVASDGGTERSDVWSGPISACSLLDKPALEKRCYIPCPPDCIQSQSTGTRDRSREVLTVLWVSQSSYPAPLRTLPCDLFSVLLLSLRHRSANWNISNVNYSSVTSRVSTSSHLCCCCTWDPLLLK